MDGVLVIDKPEGLTSHDVVAAARRALRERRIGHTGTLDPLATGVLPLACGQATRLVRFLAASDKDYDATIRFGVTTATYDVTGTETSRSGRAPERELVERGLAGLKGEYLQMPPAYSAKKVGGQRAYEMARRDQSIELKPVPVRVTKADLVAFEGGSACVRVTCSAGFYVRSFAHTLGELVGTGACLEALRRTRSGEFSLEQAIALGSLLESSDVGLQQRIVPLDRLLGSIPAVQLTSEERARVSHGLEVERIESRAGDWVRLLDSDGHLIAMATRGRRPDSLHPAVVLI